MSYSDTEYCNRCDKDTKHTYEKGTPAWQHPDWSEDRAPSREITDFVNGDILETVTCT